MIFAFDPGEKRTGFVMVRYIPERKMGDLRIEEILDEHQLYDRLGMLESMGEDRASKHEFVIENYVIDPNRPPQIHSWSEVHTIRRIGSILATAHRMGCKATMQPNTVLTMARKWCNHPRMPRGKQHIPDDIAAYAHAVQYMLDKGMIRDTIEDVMLFGQEVLG